MDTLITIAIGADHRGYEHKLSIISSLSEYKWFDIGTDTLERTDYPLYAYKVCKKIQQRECLYGVLLCATGVGMAIAANRFKEIYAALAWNEEVARRSKEEDSSNVLIIPSDYVSRQQTLEMVKTWITASPKPGRYQERLDMINQWGGVIIE
jgi:ribose 5-phosphate isomerase B